MTHTPNALEEVIAVLEDCRSGYQYIRDYKTPVERDGIGYERCIKSSEAAIKTLRAYMVAQANATKNKFNIGDIVQVSPNYKYQEDWKGVKLEIVGIYRAKPIGYSTPNETPPIKYSVKDIEDNWNYGFTDDFNGDDLLPAPTMQGE